MNSIFIQFQILEQFFLIDGLARRLWITVLVAEFEVLWWIDICSYSESLTSEYLLGVLLILNQSIC